VLLTQRAGAWLQPFLLSTLSSQPERDGVEGPAFCFLRVSGGVPGFAQEQRCNIPCHPDAPCARGILRKHRASAGVCGSDGPVFAVGSPDLSKIPQRRSRFRNDIGTTNEGQPTQHCHPDRSEAESRDLLTSYAEQPTPASKLLLQRPDVRASRQLRSSRTRTLFQRPSS